MNAGASNGEVTSIGPTLSFSFTDPDGAEHEVLWNKPGVPIDDSVRRANWTTVDLEEGGRQG